MITSDFWNQTANGSAMQRSGCNVFRVILKYWAQLLGQNASVSGVSNTLRSERSNGNTKQFRRNSRIVGTPLNNSPVTIKL